MAVINQAGEWIARHTRRVSWEGLANEDEGAPDGLPSLNHKTIQVTGTFGTGGTVQIQGSNDGGDTYSAVDDGGSALEFTAAGFAEIHAPPALLKPVVTVGDGTTSLNVYLVEVHG